MWYNLIVVRRIGPVPLGVSCVGVSCVGGPNLMPSVTVSPPSSSLDCAESDVLNGNTAVNC